MLESGSTLGNYQIKKILGIGGFGVTYQAFDQLNNKDVAIKEYFPGISFRDKGSLTVKAKSYSHQQEYDIGLNRFYKEAEIIAQFNHINIVRILNIFEGNGTAYIVMEFEHGKDLDQYLKHIGRPLSYNEIIKVFMPLLDGLRAVHKKGVLHLDIKPDNIFIRTNTTPCLIDFGGARHQAAQESRLVVAKVSFMVAADGFSPPEQYNSASIDKGPWSDIYALGATIYACMNNGESPANSLERAGDLMNEREDPLCPATILFKDTYPEKLLELVDSCLSPQRAKRPQNAEKMQDILLTIANNESLRVEKQSQKIQSISKPAQLHDFVNSSSPSQQYDVKSDIQSGNKNLNYAGFWLRCAALILDMVLILIISFGVGIAFGLSVDNFEATAENNSTFGLLQVALVIAQWLYFAGMESSKSGGTFGKRAVGIKVVDLNGGKISFSRASGRYLGKILSYIILLIGFIMTAFTSKKQSLHDMMAGTIVIKKNKGDL